MGAIAVILERTITEVPGILLTPLKIIPGPQGDVLRALRADEAGFDGFAEAYFSSVHSGAVKGWKRHSEMLLNLVVPIGSIRFCAFRDSVYGTVTLSPENYFRLTVAPGTWLSFGGVGGSVGGGSGAGSGTNMLLNLANRMHASDETEARSLDDPSMPRAW